MGDTQHTPGPIQHIAPRGYDPSHETDSARVDELAASMTRSGWRGKHLEKMGQIMDAAVAIYLLPSPCG